VKQYLWNILVAIDQLINTVAGGDPDETLSSVMGKKIKRNICPICKLICFFLSQIDPNHCEKSIEVDEGKDAVVQ